MRDGDRDMKFCCVDEVTKLSTNKGDISLYQFMRDGDRDRKFRSERGCRELKALAEGVS
jgi:hypothetical protein